MAVNFPEKELMDQINSIVDQEVNEYEAEVRMLAEQIYETIVDASPIWTGYYASNHTISLRGPGGQFKAQAFSLRPAEKETDDRLAYFGNIEPRVNEELVKLERFTVGDSINFRNDVPYADEIEREGTATSGGNIYANAAAQFGLDFD